MFDIIIPLVLWNIDEKEEIDLPVLRLTPEPVMPDPMTFGSDACPSLASPTSPVSSPSKESKPKEKAQPQQPSSPSVIGQSMSQIVGIRPPLTHTNSLAKLPTYGVVVEDEEQLCQVAKGIDLWGMDMFLVRELSNGHPLLTIFYTILKVSISVFD